MLALVKHVTLICIGANCADSSTSTTTGLGFLGARGRYLRPDSDASSPVVAFKVIMTTLGPAGDKGHTNFPGSRFRSWFWPRAEPRAYSRVGTSGPSTFYLLQSRSIRKLRRSFVWVLTIRSCPKNLFFLFAAGVIGRTVDF